MSFTRLTASAPWTPTRTSYARCSVGPTRTFLAASEDSQSLAMVRWTSRMRVSMDTDIAWGRMHPGKKWHERQSVNAEYLSRWRMQ